MRVLILGSGGREHALAWRMSLDDVVNEIYVLPGNPGMELTPKVCCLPASIEVSEGFKILVDALEPDLVVVGPEGPLCQGIVDLLKDGDFAILGPTKDCAKLEGSKSFAKEFMREFLIPTPEFEVFTSSKEAKAFLELCPWRDQVVVKADGLAQGKGVFVTQNQQEAQAAIENLLDNPDFEIPSKKILIEKKFSGRELSVIALCDGEEFMILGMAQDYKRLLDGDKGPNTGGMGCITPEDFPSQELRQRIDEEVFQKVLTGLKKRKMKFRGVLFAGLMIAQKSSGEDELTVLEFNTRFGDPETQTILPLIEGPFTQLLLSCAQGELSKMMPKIFVKNQHAIHVVLTSEGYALMDGTKLNLGHRLSFDDSLISRITHPPYGFMAGVKKISDENEQSFLVNSGGRVMGVTCLADSLQEARSLVYEAIKRISFEGAFWREDIGK